MSKLEISHTHYPNAISTEVAVCTKAIYAEILKINLFSRLNSWGTLKLGKNLHLAKLLRRKIVRQTDTCTVYSRVTLFILHCEIILTDKYLQNTDVTNICILNITTETDTFHSLRKQVINQLRTRCVTKGLCLLSDTKSRHMLSRKRSNLDRLFGFARPFVI